MSAESRRVAGEAAFAVAHADSGLEMRDIAKRFGGVRALGGVSFDVRKGEVHALIGQNGAGKSTLMGILSGSLRPDDGEIRLDGIPVQIADPSVARAMGLAIVRQEFALCPNLTVAENIFLGKEPTNALGVVDYERMRAATIELLKLVHVSLEPNAATETLGVSEWQIIEICKALADNPRYVIMDEPTAALGNERVKDLLEIVRRLRDGGHGIVYISHKLSEVLAVADRVTVLRDGYVVETLVNEGLTEGDLVSAMLGVSIKEQYRREARQPDDEVALEVRHLSRGEDYADVSFDLHWGEVLGITGILGSGMQSLVRSLFGIDPADAGSVCVAGRDVSLATPADAIRVGFGYVPADRKGEGLILPLSVYENSSMTAFDSLTRFGLFDFNARRKLTTSIIETLGIKVANPATAVANLSGGNQQKVSIGKWLAKECRILMLEEPSRGIDVRAKAQVWQTIGELAKRGVAIIVVSSELPELLQECDRLLVMRRGRVINDFERTEFDENLISVKIASDV